MDADVDPDEDGLPKCTMHRGMMHSVQAAHPSWTMSGTATEQRQYLTQSRSLPYLMMSQALHSRRPDCQHMSALIYCLYKGLLCLKKHVRVYGLDARYCRGSSKRYSLLFC